MRRRDFISLIGGASAWPLVVRAQQSTVPVVGILVPASASSVYQSRISAFRRGLKETGYAEGQVAVELRWADGQYGRLPVLAADLVRDKVDVIVTLGGTATALAAKAATNTIPIVFLIGADPVESGLVASFGRPGGNITGMTTISMFGGKHMEILFEIAPAAAARMGLLVNPANPLAESFVKAAVDQLGDRLIVANARSDSDFDTAFATLVKERAGGLVIWEEPFFNSRIDRLAALAARHAIPTIASPRAFTEAGGMVSYGIDGNELAHQIGVYTGRILKGTKPADLPVQQPTKFELVINLKAAKALALTVPPVLLARADEVIE